MAARGSKGTSSLFTPLSVVDVLIPDEVVQYNERKHWASLIQPFLETVALLILITMVAGGLPDGALGGLLFLLAAAVTFVMYRQRKWTNLTLYAGAAGVVIGFILLGLEALAIALILAAAGRFIYRAGMWAFYERLLITNRRVIASSGFLGAHIDAMPLTRITDIAFKRTVPGEIIGYGTLRVETAGQNQALGVLPFLNQPDLFYNIVIHLSTTALGSVKDPLSREKMSESRAITIKPRGERSVRLPSILRRISPARAGGRFSRTVDVADLGGDPDDAAISQASATDFDDGT